MKSALEEVEVCRACATVPIAHLALDLEMPLQGWVAFFAERAVEVVEDDLGRPAVARSILGELLSERRERDARLAAQQAERAAAQKTLPPRGVAALEGASPMESLMAGDPSYTSPAEEFGRGGRSVFGQLLDEQLAEGQRQQRDRRAEAAAVKRAEEVLNGRDNREEPDR